MKAGMIVGALLPLGIALTASQVSADELTLGAQFQYTGTLGVTPVSGSIYDGDIHSGTFRDVNAAPSLLSGASLLSDSFVLQGGDPFGGDTSDDFEVSQADGHAVLGPFSLTTHYDFGNPPAADQLGTAFTANPDTGVLNVLNSSAEEFVGTLTLSGVAFGGIYGPAQFFTNGGVVDLLPGASINILLNEESSNYGGYNHPSVVGAPDAGSTLVLLGIGGTSLLALRRRTGK